MAAFLAVVGMLFVAFGALGWIGLVAAPAPAGRGSIAWPSAIQETPILLAIGFGFALIAAGVIVNRLDRLLAHLPVGAGPVGSGPTFSSAPATSAPAMPAPTDSDSADPALSAVSERDRAALAGRGWTLAQRKDGRWQATGRPGTVNFETEREMRDWIATEFQRRI